MKSFGNDEDSLSSNQLSFGYNDSENNTNYVIVNLFSDWRKCQNYASYLCPEKLYLSKWMSIVGGLFSSFWRLIIMTSIKLWISQSTTNQSGRKLLPHNPKWSLAWLCPYHQYRFFKHDCLEERKRREAIPAGGKGNKWSLKIFEIDRKTHVPFQFFPLSFSNCSLFNFPLDAE